MTIAGHGVEVVYIALRDYGPVPLDRFFSSYARWSPGMPHQLTVAMKGYGVAADRRLVAAKCHGVGAVMIDVPDGGLDIGTYFHAAERTEAHTLCLMNSNAEILADGWLGKLVGALRDQDGGAVSATGSWASLASGQLRVEADPSASLLRRLLRMMRLLCHFPAFPNVHLRTNALVIGRNDLLGMKTVPESKEAAWRFESGRSGLSAKLRKRGLPIRIVGRDGCGFPPSLWNRSGIFWQDGQENLLIADNQTRRFSDGDDFQKSGLYLSAWARPSK